MKKLFLLPFLALFFLRREVLLFLFLLELLIYIYVNLGALKKLC